MTVTPEAGNVPVHRGSAREASHTAKAPGGTARGSGSLDLAVRIRSAHGHGPLHDRSHLAG